MINANLIPTNNKWSDAAREAALAARRGEHSTGAESDVHPGHRLSKIIQGAAAGGVVATAVGGAIGAAKGGARIQDKVSKLAFQSGMKAHAIPGVGLGTQLAKGSSMMDSTIARQGGKVAKGIAQGLKSGIKKSGKFGSVAAGVGALAGAYLATRKKPTQNSQGVSMTALTTCLRATSLGMTVNKWSDEARAAALEARKATSGHAYHSTGAAAAMSDKANYDGGKSAHLQASKAHQEAADSHKQAATDFGVDSKEGKKHSQLIDAHTEMAEKHDKAAGKSDDGYLGAKLAGGYLGAHLGGSVGHVIGSTIGWTLGGVHGAVAGAHAGILAGSLYGAVKGWGAGRAISQTTAKVKPPATTNSLTERLRFSVTGNAQPIVPPAVAKEPKKPSLGSSIKTGAKFGGAVLGVADATAGVAAAHHLGMPKTKTALAGGAGGIIRGAVIGAGIGAAAHGVKHLFSGKKSSTSAMPAPK